LRRPRENDETDAATPKAPASGQKRKESLPPIAVVTVEASTAEVLRRDRTDVFDIVNGFSGWLICDGCTTSTRTREQPNLRVGGQRDRSHTMVARQAERAGLDEDAPAISVRAVGKARTEGGRREGESMQIIVPCRRERVVSEDGREEEEKENGL
jgi:hypothetical protein